MRLFVFLFLTLGLLARLHAQDDYVGWMYGNITYGIHKVRSVQTFQHLGSAIQEVPKTKIGSISADLAYDHHVSRWIMSTALGYTKNSFTYANYIPGSKNSFKSNRTMNNNSFYLRFTPRYLMGSYFSVAPRTQIYFGQNSFHSESSSGTGKVLAYIGPDFAFDYTLERTKLRSGFFGLIDINEKKRTAVYIGLYLGIGFGIVKSKQDGPLTPSHSNKRPILKTNPNSEPDPLILPDL